MAKNNKADMSCARVKKYSASDVSKAERHNERKNETYENMNVIEERIPFNVHFKKPFAQTYMEQLKQMEADGLVSLRGLRKDATLFNEIVIDVNLTQKHGFYYVVLNLPTDEKGKRNRKTLSTGLSTDRNATKAKALLQTMIRAASAGEEVHGVKERVAAAATEDTEESWNTPHPNMLFSNYLEFWLQWKRKSWEEVTYSGYCQNVRSWIAPYFSARKVRLNEITVLDIEMFYTHEINKRGVSGNTVLHYHANIRKALSDAVKLKLIPYNPAAEVERPKKDNFVASYYSADELMKCCLFLQIPKWNFLSCLLRSMDCAAAR